MTIEEYMNISNHYFTIILLHAFPNTCLKMINKSFYHFIIYWKSK